MIGRYLCRISARRSEQVTGRNLILLLTALCLLTVYKNAAAAITARKAVVPAAIPEEVIADWKKQDNVATVGYARAVRSITGTLPASLAPAAPTGTSEDAYLEAAYLRRLARLQAAGPQVEKILYAKHFDLGGQIIGFIEDLRGDGYTSPVQGAKFNFPGMSRGSNYKGGSALMVVELENGVYGTPTTLLSDNSGVIRDPCLSYDGMKVAFAWSKDNNGYHIWEMDLATKTTRQLTDDPAGLTVSDFEPCYLPNGDILFNSSRCFGQVDCNFNITCNLFLMNGDGKYLRQVGYDQVHTFYPTMMSTGKVLYCRWEYNDRNVSNVFGIFTMNIDGSHQIEYFGNQTSTPATLNQAREIPGTDGKLLATTGGHMGMYCGDLCVVDPNLGRNGKASCQLVAPKREWPGGFSMDGVPEETKLFQNPYPINETWFLISYRTGTGEKYGIYLMNLDGDRELIASDASMSVSQPIPLAPRPLPNITAYQVDYTESTAAVTMSNAYYGSGTNGTSSTGTVKAGTIDKVRVIAIEYRISPWFGNVGADAYTCTPVARWMGSWEAKRIVGEMPVESDGSSAFIVPARVPLYLQLIDKNGCAVNSMRSWMTLQPGEKFSCYGCHEDKNIAPPPIANPIAATPKKLVPFYDLEDDYFSFPRYIQPILDKNCISCHKAGHESDLDLTGTTFWTGDLTNDADNKTACKYWSNAYYNLTAGSGGFSGGTYVNYITVMSGAEGLRPNSVGAVRSALITRLRGGHVDLAKEELDKLCAWIDLCIPYSGHYTEGMKATDSAAYMKRFNDTRDAYLKVDEKNIQEFISDGQYTVPPYRNTGIDSRRGSGKPSLLQSAEKAIHLRFSRDARILTVTSPCEGTIVFLDLNGREVFSCELSREMVSSAVGVPLRITLPRGLYIVNFSGKGISTRRTFAAL